MTEMVELNLYYDGAKISEDTPLDFGDVMLGQPKTLLLTLKNEEETAVRNLQPILAEDFSVSDFPLTLLAGEERPFHLSYTPIEIDFQEGKKVAVHKGDELVLRVIKQVKGILKITGEVMRVKVT